MLSIPSILVIDDDPDAAKTLAQLLTALGVKDVREASSGEMALDILKTQSFSMILVDYRMQGMNGVEFLEKVRAKGDETPILLVSGAPEKAAVIRAANYKKVDFIGKPFRMAELLGAVQKLASA